MERFNWYVPGTKHTPFIAFNGLSDTFSEGIVGGGGGGYTTPSEPEPEIELIEVVSKEININEGGIIEVTDPDNELFGVKLIIEPIIKQEKGISDEIINVILSMGITTTCKLPEYQGYLLTPIVIMADIKDVIPGLSKIEIPYNEKQFINSAVPLDAQIHVLNTIDIRMPWEELSPEQYIIENNVVTIPINWTDNYPGLFDFYTLSVDNAIPPDPVDFNDPLPGDLLYKFSKLLPFKINEGWLPGHVGIYVGDKYDEENDKKYNVIEALLGGVQRTYYEDIDYFSRDSIYLGAREPEYGLSHGQRNLITAFAELAVGMPYAFFETFTSMIYSGLGRGDWVKGDGNFNCVGLAEAAYEYAGIDLVSDFDEGNQEWSAHDILTPAEQWYKTVPASGIIDQNIAPEIDNLEISQAIDLMNGHWMYTLNCNASDQDGDILTYIWSRNEGEGTFLPDYNYNDLTVTNGKEIRWVSPFDEGEYTITCKVIDNYGGEDTKSKTINVGGSDPVHNLTQDTYYNTIQAALDDADTNNTIEVSDGIYDESIIFPSYKKITLQSVNGASSTIIRGDHGSNTVTSNMALEGTTLEGFTITHESGNNGRGIYNFWNLIIKNCNISGNNTGSETGDHAIDDGGGIMNLNDSDLTIINSSITDNTAACFGGGIINTGTLIINDCTISSNNAAAGGGIMSVYGSLTITGSTISDNNAEIGSGGGINYYSDDSQLFISESTISNNFSDYFGGGIHVYTMHGCIATINNSTIKNNSSTWCGGGIENGVSLTINNSTITGNSSNDGGGGIRNDGQLSINECIISNNSANNYVGGGIFDISYSGLNKELIITGSTISNNSADLGGGIFNTNVSDADCTFIITSSIISSNSATSNGGGILIANPMYGTIAIGASNSSDLNNFNTFTDNYKTGNTPSPDQHICNSTGDCHMDYPYNNYSPDTPQDVLTVSTKGTDYIETTSAGVVGTIYKIGCANVDEVGFEYEDLTDSISFPPISHSVNLSYPGEFSDDLTNLEPGHQYKFKFYAHNPVDGRKEGEWKYFTTQEDIGG